MRNIVAAVAILVASVGTAAAQESRFAIAPTFGYAGTGPLFEHSWSEQTPGANVNSSERLKLDGAPVFGAAIAYRPTGTWWIEAEILRGSGSYTFDDVTSGGNEIHARGDATRTSFGLTLLRQVRLAARGPLLGVGLGASMHRIRMHEDRVCMPPSGGIPQCSGGEPWQVDYDVPGIAGKLYLQQPLTRSIGLRVGAAHSIGRANTESMWVDLAPELDHLEAPKSQRVHATSWTAALTISL